MRHASEPLELFGVTLIGATPENLRKLLMSAALLAAVLLATWLIRAMLKSLVGSKLGTKVHFWARQAVSLFMALLLLLGIASIWFDNPARMATMLGLLGAGLAFAL